MPHRPQRIGNYPVLKKDTPQVSFATCVGVAGVEPGRGVTNFRCIATHATRGAVTLVMGSQDSINVPANRYNFVGVPLDLPRGFRQAQTFLCAYNFEFSADFSQHNLLLGGLFVGRSRGLSVPAVNIAYPMSDSIYMLPLQTSYVNATGDHCNASASGAFVMEYEPAASGLVDAPILGWYTHNASAGVVNVDDMIASLSWHVYEEDIPIFDPNR